MENSAQNSYAGSNRNAGDRGDTVTLVKERLTIVDVVTPYVKLARAGKYLRGLSPFTKEKTPSFFVNEERGSYYCFSTNQGGDIFTFIEKMEGVDFRGALKILAEKAGVEIVYEKSNDGRAERVEKLREAMTQAVAFFSQNLSPESAAYAYVLSRGLTKEMIDSWQLGFAPDSWRGLLEALQAKGFSSTELVAAGLIKEADGRAGTWYDRFRNRVMIPIRDGAGRTVAFTGRTLDPNDGAKYLNSPETELFKKSEVLFGMDRAKDAIRMRGFAILVEGQFDLLLLHQIGFTNTIALSGTALTPQHLALIKRYADNLMLCLDADRAGLAASAKHAEAALRAGFRVKAVRLPEGKDPADLASTDPSDFTKRVADATSIVEFFLGVLAASGLDAQQLISSTEHTILPLLSVIQSPLEREHFIGLTARTLALSSEAVKQSLVRYEKQNQNQSQNNQGHTQNGSANTNNNNGAPPFSSQRTNPSSSSVLSSKDIRTPASRRGELLLAVAANYPDTPLAEMLKNEYSRIIGAPVPDELISERALFEAGLTYTEPPTESDLAELVREFEHAVIKERLREATDALRRAELSGDTDAIALGHSKINELYTRRSSLS